MPHLKFSRDKKGYEYTSLVRPARKGGRGEPRILYWFRTPPHVKVGRSALDEEAIRLIEEHHPDITFDWPRILKAQPVIVEEPRAQQPEPREARKRKGERRGPQAGKAPRGPQGLRVAEPERLSEPARHVPPEPLREPTPEPSLEPSLEPSFEPAPQLDDLKEPTMIEAAVQENGVSEWDAPVEAESLDRTSEGEGAEGAFLSPRPVEALVGTEGLERLRARHAALLAAISERIEDAAKREFLRGEAERVDPDNWVTIDAAKAALETYESDYESIRRELPPRRKRRRRGRRSKNRQGSAPASVEQSHSAEGAAPAEDDNGSGAPGDDSEEPEP